MPNEIRWAWRKPVLTDTPDTTGTTGKREPCAHSGYRYAEGFFVILAAACKTGRKKPTKKEK